MKTPDTHTRTRTPTTPTAPAPRAATRRGRLAALLAASALVVAACDKDDEIRAYQTPKETPFVPAATPASAPAPSSGPTLAWDLPDGWTQSAGGADMRLATLTDARTDPPTVVTVTMLPGSAGSLLANVNRWRRQIGLEAVGEDALGSMTRPLEGGRLAATVVDMVGPGAQAGPEQRLLAAIFETPGFTWFFKASADHEVVGASEASVLTIFRSVHEASAGASAPAMPAMASDMSSSSITSMPTAAPLAFDLPEGWTEDPTERPARLTTILAGSGEDVCELAVTRFPGDVGGELMNVNRWRAQLGLPAVDSTANEDTTPVEIDGVPGKVYRFSSPGEAPGRAGMLVAMADQGGSIWFFKMTGPAGPLSEQRDRFVAFLRSVRLPHG